MTPKESGRCHQKVSLFEELGLDPDNFTWEQLAGCNNMDSQINWFFDDYEQDPIIAKNATQICYNCPVVKACFEWATEAKAEGLHGGVYMVNGKVDRARNKNKTKGEWEWLEKQLGQKIKGSKSKP